MVRSGALSLWVLKSCICILFVFALTSCHKNKGGKKKKTDPGKIGSVTLAVPASGTSVQLYAKVELLVTFATLPSTTLQYDPDPTRGGMNLTATFTGPGGTFTVPGFYDGTNWRIRFAPLGTGKYTYQVSYEDPDSKGTWSEGEFTCIASTFKGFARIQGRYLKMTNGAMIYPVGHNIGWLVDVEQPSLSDMATHGENLLCFWIAGLVATGSRGPIENASSGVGNYNQTACTFLDGLVGRAEAANVFLQPTMWSHGQLRLDEEPWDGSWWNYNGYSDPAICATPADFFVMSTGSSDSEQWRYQKNFFRYLFARYGYSRAILNWVAIAEVNGTGGWIEPGGPNNIKAWLQAVRNWWRDNDFYRRNADNKTTLSGFATDGAAISGAGALVYDPELDTVSTDTYMHGYPNSFAATVLGTETMALRGPGKPCFHGEMGGADPGDPSIQVSQPGPIAHKGLWAATTAGACMTPPQWTDGYSWVLLTEDPDGTAIRTQLQCLAAFMAEPEVLACLGDPAVTSVQVVSPSFAAPTQTGWVTHTTTQGFGWIKCDLTAITGCTVSGLANGTYQIDWYNVSGSSPVLSSSVPGIDVSTTTLTFDYPGIPTDLAFRFRQTAPAMVATTPSSPATSSVPRAVPPPTEGGTPPDTEAEPMVIVPSGYEEEEETPAEPEEPVKPPTEF